MGDSNIEKSVLEGVFGSQIKRSSVTRVVVVAIAEVASSTHQASVSTGSCIRSIAYVFNGEFSVKIPGLIV